MSEDLPPLKPCEESAEKLQAPSYFYGADDMVALIVGSEQLKMVAHATYLTRNSDFFKAAMKKEWLEGQTKTIRLPEEEPELIARYLDFIYGRPLPTKPLHTDDEGSWDKHWDHIAELFVVGERLLDRAFQNALIAEFIELSRDKSEKKVWLLGDKTVRTIYEGTLEGSPARRLLVDLYVSWARTDWRCTSETVPKQFALDVMRAFVDKIDNEEEMDSFKFREVDFVAENYMV